MPAIIVFALSLGALGGCRMAPCREPSRTAQESPSLMETLDSPAAKAGPKKGSRAIPTKEPSSVLVFKYNGERQCGEGSSLISVESMEKELAGISVHSRSVRNDGVLRIAMCGTTTGNANVYEISSSDLSKAHGLGFRTWPPPK